MEQDLVKSAARALQILEAFATERRRVSSAQLGTLLGYPKSSLSVLLKSLVTQGYLENGGGEQDFFPTLKLARLGEWIPAALLGSGALLPMLNQLRDKTGETVTLTMPAGLDMRCLHALIGTHPISLQVEEGVSFPIIGTAVGTMYLATQSDALTRDLYERWTTSSSARSRGSLADLMDQVNAARRNGYAAAYDAVLPDTGALSIAVRSSSSDADNVLVVTVAGLNHRISQQEAAIVKTMRRIAARIGLSVLIDDGEAV